MRWNTKKSLDNFEARLDLYRKELSEYKSEVRNNYTHKTDFWKVRNDAVATILKEFGGEIIRLEAMIQGVLDVVAKSEPQVIKCKTCGHTLTEDNS